MIAALHITRMLRCTLHFFDVIDTYMLIYNYILQNGILTDDYIRKDYAVLHYGTFFDDTATAQNGVVNRAFDAASVGNNRCFDICTLQILCRTAVARTCNS